MPVLAILGAKDVMINSAGTREALLAAAPHARVDWLADEGHMLMGYGPTIDAFLAEALRP